MSWRLIAGAAFFACFTLCVTLYAPASAGPDCKCRYFGKFYGLGESICIRGRVATCALVLNNSSWQFTGRPCAPSAMRQSRPRSVAQTKRPSSRHAR
jgi:hypothetical protein